MNTVVMRAELEFENILQEHEELLDQARGFGMRTAAYPRGLMPLREAQEVVANFSKNTAKLDTFLSSLYDTKLRAPDDDTKAALNEVYARGEKALRKFQDDHKKAKEALEKHEDLLVGENFQEMFQALRLAVLDLDLTDNADFTAKTQLYLDADPAYGVGIATVSRTQPKEDVYKVRATYKAETDEYIADMWSKKSNRWFPAAKKTGHTRIPAFVRAVIDKMKAVHDFEGESMFGSRHTVEDTSPELTKYRDEVEQQKQREKAEIEQRNLREQSEKNWAKVMKQAIEIRAAIDRALKARFPDGKSEELSVKRYEEGHKGSNFPVSVWNSLWTSGGGLVEICTTVKFVAGTDTFTFFANYGLPTSGSLDFPVHAKWTPNSNDFVKDVVKAVSKFIASDAEANRSLSRKIDDVAAQVQGLFKGWALGELGISVKEQSSEFAKGIASKAYEVSLPYNQGGWPSTAHGYFTIVAKTESQNFNVKVKQISKGNYTHTTDLLVDLADTDMAERIGSLLLKDWVRNGVPILPAPPPKSTVAPSGGSGGVTPHIRAVLRELRGLRIGYPGTLGAAAETEINKVLTGAAPSITLTVSKLFPVEDSIQSDVQAIQDFARKVQVQYKNGTAQVGNVTITQKVTLKYRATISNSLVTQDALDLADAVGKYFVHHAEGVARRPGRVISPAMVKSFIAAVEVTVSRQGGRTASTTRTAGSTTFDNLVWNPNISNAFRDIRSEELEEHGHREGYPGTIAAKSRYEVRATEPMTEAEARAFMAKDVNNNDKWSDRAFAVPVTRAKVLTTDKVTVTITARDEKEALRQAQMRIYATGRFPPNANVVVSDLVPKKVSETPRTKTFEITGTRRAVLVGTTDGWLFYGWAPE